MKKEVWNEFRAEKFLAKFVPVAKSQLVKKFEDIKIKAPCVLKIISDDALHKTEVKGVRVVKRQEDLEIDFGDLIRIAKKGKISLDGILVQEFLSGIELIIGLKRDEIFGQVLLFGVGGIFTEVLKDFSTRKCPIKIQDADEMIDELKARDIFYGARGIKLNRDLMRRVLAKISEVGAKYKNINELDINPFVLNEKFGKVADARIVIEK